MISFKFTGHKARENMTKVEGMQPPQQHASYKKQSPTAPLGSSSRDVYGRKALDLQLWASPKNWRQSVPKRVCVRACAWLRHSLVAVSTNGFMNILFRNYTIVKTYLLIGATNEPHQIASNVVYHSTKYKQVSQLSIIASTLQSWLLIIITHCVMKMCFADYKRVSNESIATFCMSTIVFETVEGYTFLLHAR